MVVAKGGWPQTLDREGGEAMELLSLIVKTAGVVVQALAVYVAYQALNQK
ncbi:hypothetical protein GCM10007416_34710 [Kroppenstedtia guangzhouensis]|uniref:Maff2 family protein n=1 Tax=Kroppenstedtia guangzhouensis TaxID=1274356 RepID=A0ABQ1H629_9BACL|nr:hypothetical protein GCM10007416_34710 [Kroppenstedtia guangzhouensis]